MSRFMDLTVRRSYFYISGAVLVLDQITKVLAHAILRGHAEVTVIPGLFNLDYSRNRGALFGLFGTWDEPWRTVLLTLFPLIAIAAVGIFLARTNEPDRSTLCGLALILGGATGNMIDRIFRGEVVDFLDVYISHAGMSEWLIGKFGTAHWPTFNIADSAIVVGACLLVLDIFRPDKRSDDTRKA